MKNFETIVNRILLVLAGIPLLLLTGYSLLTTGIDYEGQQEGTVLQADNVVGNLLILAVVLLALYGLSRLFRRVKDYLPIAVIESVLMGIVSGFWVLLSRTKPTGDQALVWGYADCINRYEYFPLKWGGYLVYYQNQLGLMTVERVFLKLFGRMEYPYVAFQLFNACMVPVIVFSGFMICRHIADQSKRAEQIYLLLMPLFVPLYVYVPYVYGEIASVAMVMLSAYMLLEALEKFKLWKAVLCGLSAAAAVVFRTNAWVMILAMTGVLCIVLFKRIGALYAEIKNQPNPKTSDVVRKAQRKVVQAVFLILFILEATYGINNRLIPGRYEPIMEQEHDSIPGIVLVAMGTNDEGISPGWHNNYDVDTYFEAETHADVASQMARETLEAFLDKCKKNPGYALDFYGRKMSSQWNTPFYGCFRMNSLFREEPTAFVDNLYFGDGNQTLWNMMNIWQLLVYLACLLSIVVLWKKGTDIIRLLPLVYVYGGFLLSLIWEAKSRYVLPYVIVMIPIAAMSLAFVFQWVEERVTGRKQSASGGVAELREAYEAKEIIETKEITGSKER